MSQDNEKSKQQNVTATNQLPSKLHQDLDYLEDELDVSDLEDLSEKDAHALKLLRASFKDEAKEIAFGLQETVKEYISLEEKNVQNYNLSDSLISSLNEEQKGKYTEKDEINLEAIHSQNLDKHSAILASEVSFNSPAETLLDSKLKEDNELEILVSMDDELTNSIEDLYNNKTSDAKDSYTDMLQVIGNSQVSDNDNQGKRVYTAVDQQKQLLEKHRTAKALKTNNKEPLNESELDIEKLNKTSDK